MNNEDRAILTRIADALDRLVLRLDDLVELSKLRQFPGSVSRDWRPSSAYEQTAIYSNLPAAQSSAAPIEKESTDHD